MRPSFTTPLEPSSSAQPSVRATTEISSGPMTTSRQTRRQSGFILLRMYASGTPKKIHSSVTTTAILSVRPKIS